MIMHAGLADSVLTAYDRLRGSVRVLVMWGEPGNSVSEVRTHLRRGEQRSRACAHGQLAVAPDLVVYAPAEHLQEGQ